MTQVSAVQPTFGPMELSRGIGPPPILKYSSAILCCGLQELLLAMASPSA